MLTLYINDWLPKPDRHTWRARHNILLAFQCVCVWRKLLFALSPHQCNGTTANVFESLMKKKQKGERIISSDAD